MSNDNKGLDTAREVAEKLREEVKETNLALAEKAALAANLSKEALEYMCKHQNTGVEDLNTGVSVPQLRIHSTGVSTKNLLADGSDPKDGQMFYTGTQEAFDKVTVVLLAIKKCRLEQLDDKTNQTYMKANYLLAGVIDETLQPFIIYVKGMSYNKIWALEEQLKPYVTKRKGGIPLSMVKIIVSSEKEVVEQGKYKGQKKNVLKFELKMDATNTYPVLEGDVGVLETLEKATESAENMLNDIIAAKGMTEKQWNDQKKQSENLVAAADEVFAEGVTEADQVTDDTEETDDIPF